MTTAQPVSLARGDLVPWVVQQAGYTGKKAQTAQVVGDDAYDWLARRAGQLHPDQREDQQTACQEYVTFLARSRSTTLGILLLSWIVSAIISTIVRMLFEHIFSSPAALTRWQDVHVRDDG